MAVERGRKPSQRCERPSAVSLFSGAGGFCEGVRLANYDVVCAVEADRHACSTHSTNFPEVPLFAGDIRRFLRDERPGVPRKKELKTRGIDLVYGGPPCQGFSQIGPRDYKDPRNTLYQEFVRIITELTPKTFIMENVIHPRLDQLLQPLLWVGSLPHPAADRRLPGPLGPQQVQAAPVPDRGGKGVVRSGRPRQPGPVCPLAPTVCRRTNIGSRMSREAHVRIWERVGVRFPCATRHSASREIVLRLTS